MEGDAARPPTEPVAVVRRSVAERTVGRVRARVDLGQVGTRSTAGSSVYHDTGRPWTGWYTVDRRLVCPPARCGDASSSATNTSHNRSPDRSRSSRSRAGTPQRMRAPLPAARGTRRTACRDCFRSASDGVVERFDSVVDTRPRVSGHLNTGWRITTRDGISRLICRTKGSIHGRKSRGRGSSHPEFGVGTLMQTAPYFHIYRSKHAIASQKLFFWEGA